MGKHTSGEWFTKSDSHIYTSTKGVILSASVFNGSDSEKKANASLIVKAVNNHEQLLSTIHFAALDLTNIINGVSTKSLYAVHNSLETALAQVEKG